MQGADGAPLVLGDQSSVEEWLKATGRVTEDVAAQLIRDGATDSDALLQVTIEDLQDLGVKKLQARALISQIAKELGGGGTPSKPANESTSEASADDISQAVSASQPSLPLPSLAVFFSAPLVGWNAKPEIKGIPEPNSLELLDYNTERMLITEAFSNASNAIDLSFNFATTKAFQRELLKGATALHYSGHGNDRCLVFEDGNGSAHMVTVDQLRELFSACSAPHNTVAFVFVCACQSEAIGTAFVAAGVPSVVACAMDDRISDTAARVFEDAFYLSLARGNSVEHSFEIGKQAVATTPSLITRKESQKFVLLPEGNDHSRSVFGIVRHVEKWIEPKPFNLDSLPPPVESFIGRNVEMFHVLDSLSRGRCVSICGPAGVGKSALAMGLANYISERKHFADGVCWVRARRVSSMDKLRKLVADSLGASGVDDGAIAAATMKRRGLLVIDDCDAIQQVDNAGLATLLGDAILQGADMRALLTLSSPLGILRNVGEKVVLLKKLQPADNARLLLRRSPRRINPREAGAPSQQALIAKLAAQEKLSRMLPRQVVELSALLVDRNLDALLEGSSAQDEQSTRFAHSDSQSSLLSQPISDGDPRDVPVANFYEAQFPHVDECVVVRVKQITEAGVLAELVDYGGIEGLIVSQEYSSRRMMDARKHFKVGNKEVVKVMRLDRHKGHMDLSKRKVSDEERSQCKARYDKTKRVNKILEALHDTIPMEMFRSICWPLNSQFGHAYDAFKRALSDREAVFGELGIPKEFVDALVGEIRTQMTEELERKIEKNGSKQELNCWGLTAIPKAVWQLRLPVTTLNLEGNKLEHLSEELSKLSSLVELNLNSNPIETFPDAFFAMRSLQRLYLYGALHRCPAVLPKLATMGSLAELNLDNNALAVATQGYLEIGRGWAQLTSLGLKRNAISHLAESFCALQGLTFLNLSRNDFDEFPMQVLALVNLGTLHLKDNSFSALPEEICLLNQLHTLDLGTNKLEELPHLMPSLTYLDVSHNQLSTLPREICECINLVDISLSHNCIRELPLELTSIKNLRNLLVDGNPLTYLPPELIELVGDEMEIRKQLSTSLFG